MNNIIGLDDFYIWRESDKEHLPDVSFIPPMMRRRMTDLQKIAIGVAHHVAPENTDYQMVFASRYGEWQQTLKLIKQFHDDGEMSPAGFSNSVHNAAAGVFSVLAQNKNSYISVAAGDKTLESGVLAALMCDRPVLFVFAEEKSPETYNTFLELPVVAHGLAFMLKNDGNRKIIWNSGVATGGNLGFEDMANFLENGGKIVTNSWEMADK